ncbi:hypothetical protein BX661DRAFT_178303 [Kickxella alabastrina]|uniref:uncharacterized protein n=1 Tax=Kickxella alabastrina TaxID=61397 RepID=UPI0022208F71|nr:uncharacterized protein BX661DRAFT_178303 [Kickxella alabastrina]KAI7833386.1 hypothetical protein BX661DRAFT_178303 [Kickxella alabastrina]
MSDPAAQNELIENWLNINPGTESQARFYLEANNWDLNAALSSFYEQPPLSEGLPPARQVDAALPPDPNPVAASAGSRLSNTAPVMSAGPINAAAATPLASVTPATSVPRRRQGTGARIATLSSLANQDNDDNESEEWYAGGERSGMAVRPPTKDAGEGESGSLVDRIMRRAAEGSAAAGDNDSSEDLTSESAQPRYFSGYGRALGAPGAPSTSSSGESIPPTAARPSDASGNDDTDEVAVRQLTFWRNGFSIGDGPLHNIEDPVNRQNLDAILQGRAPLSILNIRPGQKVEMKVTDRRGEEYSPPAQPPAQPFSGHGNRLGGVPPAAIVTAATSAASNATGRSITLDPSQRTVQVQIRLADGSRLVAKANLSHTVGDLRGYVLSQRPEAGSRPFAFKAIMPPKVLSDDSVTIEQAGIANAAIAQYFV